MSPEARRWKRAFEEDVEAPFDGPRVELTKNQKAWLGRAWTHVFGFIPNAIPIYNEKEGFAHRPCQHVHYHHIRTVGETMRLDGQDFHTYNTPRNIVPVENFNHTGVRAQEDDFIIHPDTHEALRNYHRDKEAFAKMGAERRKMTSNGMIYHDPSYDEYFLDLADYVTTTYEQYCPEDRWPT